MLPHGPYESGDTILLLHTSAATGVTAVGPMRVEACIPLRDCLHWKIEARDGDDERSVVVGWDGLAADGSVHRQGDDDETPVVVEDARSRVIRAALQLAAAEWDNGRSTADASMELDYRLDLFDEALDAHVDAVNEARARGLTK